MRRFLHGEPPHRVRVLFTASGRCHNAAVDNSRRTAKVRSIESAAIAGVVYAVFTVIGLYLLRPPADLTDSIAAVTTWFEDEGTRARLLVGLNLVTIASVAFLWFVAVIRRRMGDQEDRFFATVFLGSAILYVASFIVGTVALAAPALAYSVADNPAVGEASATLAIGTATGLILVVATRLQAVFMLTTSTLVRQAKVLPNWLAYLGYAGAVGLFVFPLIADPIGLAFPVWVFVVSVTIALTRPGPTAE